MKILKKNSAYIIEIEQSEKETGRTMYNTRHELAKLITHKERLQSNWNSLRDCIEENKKVATEYTKRIELSGLCQGDYPVPYYYAIKRIDLDNLYLDKMNELERNDNNE